MNRSAGWWLVAVEHTDAADADAAAYIDDLAACMDISVKSDSLMICSERAR
jgi:hypothetical protein